MVIEINTNIYTILFFTFTLLLSGVCLFFIGYFMGKNNQYYGVISSSDMNLSIKKKNKSNIIIDDKKYVVDIKTTDLEKKYEDLGERKISQENISTSINKLKNMKG